MYAWAAQIATKLFGGMSVKAIIRLSLVGVAVILAALYLNVVREKNLALKNLQIERQNVTTLKANMAQYQSVNANQQKVIDDLTAIRARDSASITEMSQKLSRNQSISADWSGLNAQDNKFLNQSIPNNVSRMLNR